MNVHVRSYQERVDALNAALTDVAAKDAAIRQAKSEFEVSRNQLGEAIRGLHAGDMTSGLLDKLYWLDRYVRVGDIADVIGCGVSAVWLRVVEASAAKECRDCGTELSIPKRNRSDGRPQWKQRCVPCDERESDQRAKRQDEYRAEVRRAALLWMIDNGVPDAITSPHVEGVVGIQSEDWQYGYMSVEGLRSIAADAGLI